MKIVLIGKTGQLGGSLLAMTHGHEMLAPGRDELDVANLAACIDYLMRHRPDVVINTAAFHDLPACEAAPMDAFNINCVAVRDLAVICKSIGARFVTFSTDYVFDGDKRSPYAEDDRTAPLQVYGMSRLAGEMAALSALPEAAYVIRTCGLYGEQGAASKGGNFVDKRIADARSLTEMEMACEQVVTPTYTGDLARALLKLLEQQAAPGIYHLVNDGACSWYEFTCAIYELSDLPVQVHPVDRQGLSGTLRRPLYSVLATEKARSLGIVIPHWKDALSRYLDNKLHTPRAGEG